MHISTDLSGREGPASRLGKAEVGSLRNGNAGVETCDKLATTRRAPSHCDLSKSFRVAGTGLEPVRPITGHRILSLSRPLRNAEKTVVSESAGTLLAQGH